MRRLEAAGSLRGRVGLALAVLLSPALLSCTGARRDQWKAEAEAEARAALAGVSFDDEESIDRVEAVRFTPQGLRAAKDVLQGGTPGAPRWAAVWTYVSNASDPEVLRPWLDDAEASIRLMAAATLVARGDASGFDALIRLLPVEDTVKGSRPSASVRTLADATLARFTGERRGTPWAAWLERNRGRLHFDAEIGLWKVR